MPLRQRPFFRPLLTGVLVAVLCVTCFTRAHALPTATVPSVCESTPPTLQCLSEQAAADDAALAHSLQALNKLLPPAPSAQLQTQQLDWLQRRDLDCSPKDRPASDSRALASASLCRSQMTQQRTALLEGLRQTLQDWNGSTEPLCTKDDAPSLTCLQKQHRAIESSMQVLYTTILLRLPEQQAQIFHAEQERWQAQRQQSCQLNGYANAQEGQVACHIRMTLERLKVYKNDWWPLSKANAQPQPQAKP